MEMNILVVERRTSSADEVEEERLVNRGAPKQTTADDIAADETRAVYIARALFAALLASVAIALAVLIYCYVSATERNDFEAQYLSDADKITQSIGDAVHTTLSAADSMATRIVSHKESMNASFPFVALPNYPIQAAKSKALANAFTTGVQLIVSAENRERWETFAATNNEFVQQSWRLQEQDKSFQGSLDVYPNIEDKIFENFPQFAVSPEGSGPYLVGWQNYPFTYDENSSPYNFDILSFPSMAESWNITLATKRAAVSGFQTLTDPGEPLDPASQVAVDFLSKFIPPAENPSEPTIAMVYPIIDRSDLLKVHPSELDGGELVGTVLYGLFWRELLRGILPAKSVGILVVTERVGCDQIFTYQIDGPYTLYLGTQNFVMQKYEHLEYERSLLDIMEERVITSSDLYSGISLLDTECPIMIRIYPSEKTESSSQTSQPIVFPVCAILVFVFAGLTFAIYDLLVERRQRKGAKKAANSSAIISDMLPQEVHNRLLDEQEENTQEKKKSRVASWVSRSHISSSHSTDVPVEMIVEGRPGIDYYSSATLLHASISGFTEWSSERPPCQVFTLLEALFGLFDAIARDRGVFKVETIFESYLAVAGVPDARNDHAVVMVRYATACRDRSIEILHSLQSELGHSTKNLSVRLGLHSGPVTGGVLRGHKARFQLFGKTVYRAANMECTGEAGRIHASQATVNLLCEAGKESWVTRRPSDTRIAGTEFSDACVQTFWVHAKSAGSVSTLSNFTSLSQYMPQPVSGDRVSHWFIENLTLRLRKVLMTTDQFADTSISPLLTTVLENDEDTDDTKQCIDTNLSVESPSIRARESAPINQKVARQLREYVHCIGNLYGDHGFHNFEHAFHVGTGLAKMYDCLDFDLDPLAEFAGMFAALIHDLDHPGIENEDILTQRNGFEDGYKGKSITQHHAFRVAWTIFLDNRYTELREALCPSNDSLTRFRQMVTDCVISTDVMNPGLSAARKRRWENAFDNKVQVEEQMDSSRQRKVTALLEHLLLTAYLTHTTQQWNFYLTWNERLYTEMFAAYRNNCMGKDPSKSWYQKDLRIFDNVTIPLLHKLESTEATRHIGANLIKFAEENRSKWQKEGKYMVEELKKWEGNESVLVDENVKR